MSSTAARTAARAAPGWVAVRLGQQCRSLRATPGCGDDEVVRHQVGVLEDELDRLARLHDEPLLVEEHLVEQRADADHAHAQLAQLLADRLAPRSAGSSAASASASCSASSAAGDVRSATGSLRT